ncbi:unnamed protein product [[Candida] boidinii]|nr:unnamed protein product [[Candida] boidinii]GMF61104.1 unnamed protein product [[Candida] boidinii]GMG39350.1 unnamed protein product [[Candida] boidinii]
MRDVADNVECIVFKPIELDDMIDPGINFFNGVGEEFEDVVTVVIGLIAVTFVSGEFKFEFELGLVEFLIT